MVPDISERTRRSCLVIKTQHQKSRETVPLHRPMEGYIKQSDNERSEPTYVFCCYSFGNPKILNRRITQPRSWGMG